MQKNVAIEPELWERAGRVAPTETLDVVKDRPNRQPHTRMRRSRMREHQPLSPRGSTQEAHCARHERIIKTTYADSCAR